MLKDTTKLILLLTISCGAPIQYHPGNKLRIAQIEVMSIGNEPNNARLDAVCIDKSGEMICAASVDEHHQGVNDRGVDISSFPILPDTVLGSPGPNNKFNCYDYKKESLALAKNGYVLLSFGEAVAVHEGDTLNVYFNSSNGGFPCPKVLHRVTAILENGDRVHLCDPIETDECAFITP